MKTGNIAENINKAKETLKGKEGVALRAARKKLKRLQRTKRKLAAGQKRREAAVAAKTAG